MTLGSEGKPNVAQPLSTPRNFQSVGATERDRAMGFKATGKGSDGNVYSAEGGSRLAALQALALVIPAGVQVRTDSVSVYRTI